MLADRTGVGVWWHAIVLESVRPGCRSSLSWGSSSTWGFPVPGGGGEGGNSDAGGGTIGGTGVFTGVITSDAGGSTATTGGTKRMQSMSGGASAQVLPLRPAQPR